MSLSRGARFVLGLLLVATILSLGAMTVLYLAFGRSPAVAQASTLTLRPAGDLPEMVPDMVLPLSDGHTLTVRGYVELIRKAKIDRRVARLLLKPGALDSPYWAKLQELRDAILDFRQSGKPVFAFLEYGGEREYYLASAADRGVPAAERHARPDRPRQLRGVPARRVRLGGHLSRLPARRRLQDRRQHVHREDASRRRTAR